MENMTAPRAVERTTLMCRKMMWGVLVVGLMLIVAPFAIGLPGKAAGGEKMIDAFGPIMDEQNVQKTADYYYDVFVPLGDVVPAMTQENIDLFNAYLGSIGGMGAEAQQLVPAFAQATLYSMPQFIAVGGFCISLLVFGITRSLLGSERRAVEPHNGPRNHSGASADHHHRARVCGRRALGPRADMGSALRAPGNESRRRIFSTLVRTCSPPVPGQFSGISDIDGRADARFGMDRARTPP